MNAKTASNRRIQEYRCLISSERIGLALICAALGVVCACSTSRQYEPSYEGKRLSTWADELYNQSTEEAYAAIGARQGMWTNVVKAVGFEGLPFYLSWIGDAGHPHHRYASIRAFEILGPTAASAIPKLSDFMKDDQKASEAAICLKAIGPASIPALINLVANVTNRGRYAAISVLGQFGKLAQSSTPILIEFIRKEPIYAMDALRVLVEVEPNTDIVIPVLVEHVANTNNAFCAAYGLGRLGRIGIPVLLESLTNEPIAIRAAVEAALDPKFQLYSFDNKEAPDSGFIQVGCIYNQAALNAAFRMYSQGDFRASAETAARYTNDPGAAIRIAANNVFRHLKIRAETNVSRMQLQRLKEPDDFTR